MAIFREIRFCDAHVTVARLGDPACIRGLVRKLTNLLISNTVPEAEVGR